ncbi:hypothetical protein RJ640_015319 [Escallonia rubra]|uniref:Spatacsin C-terminal domain-containing protein n=1 Tax=Escallonia rubra TaxID=112253 RepID=A0AA88QT94_9ASTE|nr:hypothetical protein RJ640_015319 [Escallonia rubra]
MDCTSSGEGPAILQLRKWGASELPVNLSDFREAFLSPTRELLLLHSYQREALFLPLVKGEATNDEDREAYERRETNSLASCSPETAASSRSDIRKNVPSTSNSIKMDSHNDFSLEMNSSRANSCPCICDVNSLAWGIYGDTYNQHDPISFKELLFVSGNHGVTVHAFCQPVKIADITKPTLEGESGQGVWVDWGPSTVLPHNMETVHHSSLHCEVAKDILDVNRPSGAAESSENQFVDAGEDKSSRSIAPKTWLRTFLTKVGTLKSDGNMCTRFPERSSFPSAAMVVSFSIFDSNFPLLEFLYASSTLSHEEPASNGSILNHVSSSYKCSKVFASNSHHLVGFVLTLMDTIPVNISHICERNWSRTVLVVARIVIRGIQWACSVKLDESVNTGPGTEWTDFRFSDKFLVCLNTAGSIFLYGATTGEYITHVDILRFHGISPDCQNSDDVGRRMFKRLLVASHTSLVAVIDEYGVVYVVCVGDHALEKYSSDKLVPHSQYLGLGTLVGWEIGGAKISQPRVFSNLSPNIPPVSLLENIRSKDIPEIQGIMEMRGQNQSSTSGFSAASQRSENKFGYSQLPSRIMRKVFLAADKYDEEDIICFSTFGITRFIKQNRISKRISHIVHSDLHVHLASDDRCSNLQGWEVSLGEAVGCTFQGLVYLVTKSGFSVILPSVSVSSSFFPIEEIGYRQTERQTGNLYEMEVVKQSCSRWKLEVLDRVLLYEGPEEADRLCLENGWDLKVSRTRCLQIALHYLKFEDIEISLKMLADINLAEEGILRLLFAAVYLMLHKANDNEVSAALRLLALATCFATKMIRTYGLLQRKKDTFKPQNINNSFLPSVLPDKEHNDVVNSRRLREMAHFLEIIRNLQCRLSTKFKSPAQRLVGGEGTVNSGDTELAQDDSQLSILPANASVVESSNQHDRQVPESNVQSENAEKLALMDYKAHLDSENFSGASLLVPQISVSRRTGFPVENPKDMIARWEMDNFDQKNVVKDALLSGRLPLAVLKLHLLRQGNLITGKEPHDTFTEVRDIGIAIAYDLFLKGETGLAVATLQKLGEDLEICLRQLLFGTVRRSLRMQISGEMKRYGYLGTNEWKVVEMMSLIERVYPCSSFWRTYRGRQKELKGDLSINLPEDIGLHMLHSLFENLVILCGEIDGVVLGSWANVSEHSVVPVVDDDSIHACYWAAAAAWSDAWDQKTTDRVLMDQPFLMGVNVLWESQLEYHICHNDWVEVSKLLDVIPTLLLSHGSLRINLDGLRSAAVAESKRELSDYGMYICSSEELDALCIDVPGIAIFRLSANKKCSLWLRTLMEQQLAEKFIFMKEYWEGSADIVPLLARSGFLTRMHKGSVLDASNEGTSDPNFSNLKGPIHPGAVQALHKLVVHYCAQNNLPNLLDLYLDQRHLALEDDSLSLLQDAVGECQWAKWLLFLRVKGHEYDASFSNARTIASRNLVPGNSLNVLEIDDIIRTVDDIAEGAGEMAALATLMYAPVPIQDCLSCGSVKRHCSSSAQCTLENLRPALQRFPTLWRTLVAACFGQDPTCNFLSPRAKVLRNSELLDYLNWRESIFFSAGHDTSLLQMLPCWFSKAIRRLIQLYVQGPLGWQSLAGLSTGESFLLGDIDYIVNANENAEIKAISWEAAIQKHVEEELYDSALEVTGLGLEHHLHRGRALAAFNHLLSVRVQKLKQESSHGGLSGTTVHGQTNVQSDVHTLLAPITQNEESLFSAVTPLAIVHFEDSVLVASCAFLLELCGLSARMLQIDIAALRRISSFYNSSDYIDHYRQLSPKGSAIHSVSLEGGITNSLARALADDYLNHDGAGIMKKEERPSTIGTRHSSRALMLVLQHLEKASLPPLADGITCGSWLVSGDGNGAELRSQQKAASQHWNLVALFCRMHQIPLSTKYLAVLARDNDWVGFLSEAQVGGYPFETMIQVASKEFSDPRLKNHILTVLKGMQSKKKVSSSSNLDNTEKRSEASFLEENTYIPIELFAIIAECEMQKNPGQALLLKAKDLCWSILAMVASCFADVPPLSCLTVWLEITAARETSSIKVNDIASQIANNVGAAVEATNSLSVSGRALTFHYNRRNPKRRRLMDNTSVGPLTSMVSGVSTTSISPKVFATEGISAEEERKKQAGEEVEISAGSEEVHISLSKMVAVLCEQHLFLPLLRAFEMFLPSCSLLPFIRALQAFSQMRLSEASAHLGSFSARIKDETVHVQTNIGRDGQIGTSWISSTSMKAADAMLSTCPSPYEKRCLLQLLAATDFGDGGSAVTYYRRLYWKINLAEPSLRKDDGLHLGNETLDDASLLTALEKNGHWEQARNYARQLEASGGPWKSAVNHVTETQGGRGGVLGVMVAVAMRFGWVVGFELRVAAMLFGIWVAAAAGLELVVGFGVWVAVEAESMVAEWKEFLWDVSEERVALWGHCQTLFLRYSFPPLQAGSFFLKHAEAVEKDLPARELHELLLLSLQWLSGMITQCSPVYPLHLLREIETRVWLLAVESEAQVKSEGDFTLTSISREPGAGKSSSMIDRTASIISKMDNHINTMRARGINARENSQAYHKTAQAVDATFSTTSGGSTKAKRRAKGFALSRRPLIDTVDKSTEAEDVSLPPNSRNDSHLQDESLRIDPSFSRWEERVGPAELERAVLSLLEFGQITAAKQLQHKLSPEHIPSEFVLVDAALKLAAISTPRSGVSMSMLDDEVGSVIDSYDILTDHQFVDPLQVLIQSRVLESLAMTFTEGRGRGLCKRVISVVKAANVLGLSFSEAFDKQPIELLQLLSLKAQDSFEEASLLVQTHSMSAASIAQILAESFLKGLLAAHRGGYMDSQKEEGPAPLLWRFSDFLKWADLCPSEPEIGHALMRLVITGQEIPHACEVELLILSHHFYKSSACLDGVDVLVALAATRVEAYVSEGDFPCLARLITGVGNFYALNFILGILIENGQLDLLLQKYSAAADTNSGTAEAVRGFRIAVLTSLKQFNPNDLDAFAMVSIIFRILFMFCSTLRASLLESRAEQSSQQWFLRYDKDQNEDLLDSMRYYIEAAEVHSSIDAGNKTHTACARASLVSLQIRMPDFQWLNLSETNARRALVEQSCFQEALIVAEAYGLNQASEWAPVLWNQMLNPELTEQFVAEFVAVLPLQPSMLAELARFYRAEVAARGDQSQFSVWLTGGGLPAEWAKYLGRSFRCLLKRTRDLRLRVQLATVATGFGDVIDACMKALDKVPDNAGPLVLRKGHGGAYLPLM